MIGVESDMFPPAFPFLVWSYGSLSAAQFRIVRPPLNGSEVSAAWLGCVLSGPVVYTEQYWKVENGVTVESSVTELDPTTAPLSIQAYRLTFDEGGEVATCSRLGVAVAQTAYVTEGGDLRVMFDVTTLVKELLDHPAMDSIYFMPSGPFDVAGGDDLYGFLSQWISECAGNLAAGVGVQNHTFRGRKIVFGSLSLGPLYVELDYDTLEANVAPIFSGNAPNFAEPS